MKSAHTALQRYSITAYPSGSVGHTHTHTHSSLVGKLDCWCYYTYMQVLAFDVLMNAIDITSTGLLEDLLIDAVYKVQQYNLSTYRAYTTTNYPHKTYNSNSDVCTCCVSIAYTYQDWCVYTQDVWFVCTHCSSVYVFIYYYPGISMFSSEVRVKVRAVCMFYVFNRVACS